jgi:hypothetical protein
MFIRVKKIGPYEYLYLVETAREGGQPGPARHQGTRPTRRGRELGSARWPDPCRERMRQEEVCGLDWSQVSIPRREVSLIKTKTSSPMIVPLSDVAVGTLRHITAPYVFWHYDGQRHTTFANWCRDRPPARCAVPMPRSAPPFRIDLP